MAISARDVPRSRSAVEAGLLFGGWRSQSPAASDISPAVRRHLDLRLRDPAYRSRRRADRQDRGDPGAAGHPRRHAPPGAGSARHNQLAGQRPGGAQLLGWMSQTTGPRATLVMAGAATTVACPAAAVALSRRLENAAPIGRPGARTARRGTRPAAAERIAVSGHLAVAPPSTSPWHAASDPAGRPVPGW